MGKRYIPPNASKFKVLTGRLAVSFVASFMLHLSYLSFNVVSADDLSDTRKLVSRTNAETTIANPIIKLLTARSQVLGLPISWNDKEVVILQRDGRLVVLDPNDVIEYNKLTEPFTAVPVMQLRGELQEEFGRSYSVSGTSDFIIVAAPENIAIWSEMFANLQRAFQNYFATRSYSLKRPDFPLVGIVFRNYAEFEQHARLEKVSIPQGTAGYYSNLSNRLYLFEPSQHQSQSYNDQLREHSIATICHEATHQLAYNCGVHQRLSATPIWVQEGLASIFEAPGLRASRSATSMEDLVNYERLIACRQIMNRSGQFEEAFQSMLITDRIFKTDTQTAYAVSWAVSFYLTEREPQKFRDYLKMLSEIPPGVSYKDERRMSDFTNHFGRSPQMISQSAMRFLDQID